jgi:glyoxylate utilization-related uncharacterized protein
VNKHRMTAKAAKARQLCAELYGVEVEAMRTDHPAIHGMYAELEDRGYEWISPKQEWALTNDSPTALDNTAYFVTSVEGVTAAEGLYILVEGLKAAGYDVTEGHVIYNSIDPSVVFLSFQVKL